MILNSVIIGKNKIAIETDGNMELFENEYEIIEEKKNQVEYINNYP